jgi:hypothetical protein
MCIRHVTEQEARIARQEALVERLRLARSGQLDAALGLLADMRDLLETMSDHMARLQNRD